VYNYVCEGFSI